ncbi:MAG: 6-hydroxymethylpterin diphosphokinase MptE-like protein [Candidatus Thermoplasmatota archaeon]
MNINREKDEKSSEMLDNILIRKNSLISTSCVKKIFRDKEVFVFGAGPSLVSGIEKYRNFFRNKIKISADGATSALIERGIYPNLVVSDLDGRISDQIKANKNKSIMVIHSHGDNISKVKKYTHKFQGSILGTTQVDPKKYRCLYNFGGFTDGDRAVYLSAHFKPKKIFLIGFDFNKEVGRYSFVKESKKDVEFKLKKLDWCKKLIRILEEKSKVNIEKI